MSLPSEVRKQAKQAEEIQTQLSGDPAKAAKTEETPPPAKEDQVDWEHRFKTQKKAYDETVPTLRKENEALAEEVSDLRSKFEEMQAKAETAAQNQPIFTPSEIEEYGEDFLNLIERAASQKTDDSGVKQELKTLKDQFDQIVSAQQKSAEDVFYDDLKQMVPDWEQINEDEKFHKWLAEEMPMTGQERQVFLAQAQRKLNAKQVAGFFTAWKGESGQQTHLPDTVGDGGYDQEIVVDSDIITTAEIEQFYRDKKLGKYRGKDEEARQIELKIFRAQREGRVR